MNTIAFFEIQSSKIEESKKFYSELFGWEFVKQPNLPIEYWRIKTDTIDGGLLERPLAVPDKGQGTNAFTCSIEVENFDQTAEKILSMGGIVAMDKFAIPGVCWQGYFLDNDNNVFGIFQADPHAA